MQGHFDVTHLGAPKLSRCVRPPAAVPFDCHEPCAFVSNELPHAFVGSQIATLRTLQVSTI
jgi:hypothetical protein